MKKTQKVVFNQTLLKKIMRYFFFGGIILAIIGIAVWFAASQSKVSESKIISRNGLHWHAELAIYVKGEKQEIPADIGIGVVHNPIHTHDSSGVIHFEFEGLVREDDLRLGRFFEAWEKDIMEFGSSVRMTVNGEINAELQNYIMKDGDKIELFYE